MEKDNINLIVELLTAWLRNKVNSDGMSQNRLAHQTHISQPTINSYINEGKLPGASLDYILRLFPELQRPILQVLEERGGVHISVGANSATNIASPSAVAIAGGDGSYRQRVQDLAVRLSDDNGALQLATFLKALQTLG